MFVWMRQEAHPQEVGQAEERIQEQGFTSDPRGIRTFETMIRNPLDLNAVVMLNEFPHLPVLVGASHGIEGPQGVRAMAKGAIAAGVVGAIVEIYLDPDRVWSDGMQCLDFDLFQSMMKDLQCVVAQCVVAAVDRCL